MGSASDAEIAAFRTRAVAAVKVEAAAVSWRRPREVQSEPGARHPKRRAGRIRGPVAFSTGSNVCKPTPQRFGIGSGSSAGGA